MKYENVKVGDEFLLSSRLSEMLVKVTKVTPKRFKCGRYTFNKETGKQVGATMYNMVSIKAISDEQRQQKINESKKRILVKKLSEISYQSYSLAQLESIDKFIQGI